MIEDSTEQLKYTRGDLTGSNLINLSCKVGNLKVVKTAKRTQVTNRPTRPYSEHSKVPDKLKRGFRTRANIQKIFSRF
jgi:hypothetical protein